MLLKITNVCRMECTHCLGSCEPTGTHMDMDTLIKSINMMKQLETKCILVSGGEPLEHPQFFEIIDILTKHFDKRLIIITSNGMFLSDERLRYKVSKLGINVQITNDERYYPQKIKKVIHPNFIYETHIRTLVPLGRAKNMPPINAKPSCFNFRSFNINNSFSLKQSVKLSEAKFTFCKPCINVDGSISVGESTECATIGSVCDDIKTLEENLGKMRCNRCGQISHLPESYQKAIKML